jgi:hypothetical protein
MPERTTIRLPEPLLAAAKKRAVEEGRTVTALIIEGLQRLLREQKPKKPVDLPPICPASIKSAKAGHSFTVEDLRAAEEEADFAYAKRWMR